MDSDLETAIAIKKELVESGEAPPSCYRFCRCNDSCKPCEWAWPCYFETLGQIAIMDAFDKKQLADLQKLMD